MSTRRRTSPQDWIQDYYSPILSLLASQDAELIANKNNLTFTELLAPFTKLGSDVTIKDADGTNYNVHCLHVQLQDLKKDSQKLVNQKLMFDRISEENCEPDEMVTKHFEQLTLDAPGFTVWFDIWMKLYLWSLPVADQEYLKHPFGCIFVVSTACPDPVDQFRTLVQNQQKRQHSQSGGLTPYFAPNIIKIYVLVHESSSGVTEMKAQNMFTQVQNAFESTSCHFLELNSRNDNEPDDSSTKVTDRVGDYWLQFSHRFNTLELRRDSGISTINNSTNSPIESSTTDRADFEHPLADNDLSAPPQQIIKLTQATPSSIAGYLSTSDIDRIRTMMRELVIKSIIPFAEKQIKLLHEVVVNRKSRSLFSGAKRWFGSNKGGAGAGTSPVYTKDAPELQIRKLADIYFLMKMYKCSYNHYYIAKKDFQADEAWPYYAPAVELTALSMFMLSGSEQGKKYRPDYMEDAITKYLTLCQTPEFAVRATLFDALCLKQQGMFIEAAKCYIRMTNELSDLRSAMLLEQAAYCFLLASPPSIRKYGFHIVLSGYRFAKTGRCKEHAARLYRQGAQVYDGKGWLLSSEHILYSLGHQKFMLKDFSNSSEFFNNLMSVSSGRNSLQQMVHLREYLLVHHARYKEDQAVVVISVPHILSKQISVRISESSNKCGQNWQAVERTICEGISGSFSIATTTTQPLFNDTTNNRLKPQGVVGEKIFVKVPFVNNFNTPLLLRKSFLLWKFTDADGNVFSNDKRNGQESEQIEATTLEEITIEGNTAVHVNLQIVGHSTGILNIIGVEYSLKALFAHREPTDHQIRGKQYFQISGPRLNTVKDHKTKIIYGDDFRLTVILGPPQPLLSARLKTPDSLFSGELRCIELEMKNTSSVSMQNIHLVTTHPGLLSFGKSRQQPLYEFPLLANSEPPMRVVMNDGSISQVYLDLMSVPLPANMHGKLSSGTSINIPIWIRGQVCGEKMEEDLYFYYENADCRESKFLHRLLHVPLSVKILPSIEATATRQSLSDQNIESGSNLIIRLKNVSKEGSECFKNLDISQVSLLSTENELSAVECTESSGAVTRGNTTTMALKSLPVDILSDRVDDKRQHLHFSSVASKQNTGHPIHTSPFLDFLKPVFNTNANLKKSAPKLRGDTLIVMWRTVSSQPIFGQTVIPITSGPDVAESIPIPVFTPSMIHVNYPKTVRHNFRASPFCRMNVRVEFTRKESKSSDENLAKRGVLDSGVLVQFRLVDVERGVKWTGVTEGVRWIGANESLALNLGIILSRTGLFQLKSLRFRSKQMNECELSYFNNSVQEFSSIDICFTVLQLDE